MARKETSLSASARTDSALRNAPSSSTAAGEDPRMPRLLSTSSPEGDHNYAKTDLEQSDDTGVVGSETVLEGSFFDGCTDTSDDDCEVTDTLSSSRVLRGQSKVLKPTPAPSSGGNQEGKKALASTSAMSSGGLGSRASVQSSVTQPSSGKGKAGHGGTRVIHLSKASLERLLNQHGQQNVQGISHADGTLHCGKVIRLGIRPMTVKRTGAASGVRRKEDPVAESAEGSNIDGSILKVLKSSISQKSEKIQKAETPKKGELCKGKNEKIAEELDHGGREGIGFHQTGSVLKGEWRNVFEQFSREGVPSSGGGSKGVPGMGVRDAAIRVSEPKVVTKEGRNVGPVSALKDPAEVSTRRSTSSSHKAGQTFEPRRLRDRRAGVAHPGPAKVGPAQGAHSKEAQAIPLKASQAKGDVAKDDESTDSGTGKQSRLQGLPGWQIYLDIVRQLLCASNGRRHVNNSSCMQILTQHL